MKKNIDLIKKLFSTPFSIGIEHYDKMLTEDVVLHGPMSGQEEHGLSRLKEIDSDLSKQFKKIRREINEIFALEDKVLLYWTVYAIGNGGENDGKEIIVSGHGIYRIRGEKICEIWQSWDRINFLEQLQHLKIDLHNMQNDSNCKYLKTLGEDLYHQRAALLSLREKECLRLLLQGKTAKGTAQILSLSYRTIESYFENIKNKLNCANKRELLTMTKIFERLALL